MPKRDLREWTRAENFYYLGLPQRLLVQQDLLHCERSDHKRATLQVEK